MRTRSRKRVLSGERAIGPVVLLVEDTSILGSPFAETLIREGFGIIQASSGAMRSSGRARSDRTSS
jgi:hypothetical protein